MNFNRDILPFIPLAVLFIAAVVSLRSFKNNFPYYLKAFSVYWCFVFLVDVTGHILIRANITNSNHWLYNTGQMITALFMPWFYFQVIGAGKHKLLLNGLLLVISLALLANTLFLQTLLKLQTNTFAFTGFIVVSLAAVYFWQLSRSEENFVLIRDPLFWINLGLLFYYAATAPFLGMLNYVYNHYPKFTGLYFKIVAYGFSIFLNLCIIIGFLCRNSHQKSPSS
jgi:hypothetical protein